jgi:hypothetical protein
MQDLECRRAACGSDLDQVLLSHSRPLKAQGADPNTLSAEVSRPKLPQTIPCSCLPVAWITGLSHQSRLMSHQSRLMSHQSRLEPPVPAMSHQSRLSKYCSVSFFYQCCGSGRFFTGSGSDFRKCPDPVPDPNKFLVNFFLKFFLMKICYKKYLHGPKSLTT